MYKNNGELEAEAKELYVKFSNDVEIFYSQLRKLGYDKHLVRDLLVTTVAVKCTSEMFIDYDD